MRFSGFRPAVLLALVLAGSGCVETPPLPSETRPRVTVGKGGTVSRNLVYTPPGWPKPLLADFHRPSGGGTVPAVVLIHGGAWTGGDNRWMMRPIASRLARCGYAVLNVTYRQAPAWNYPAPIEDIGQAVAWLRANAGEKGIDPGRIATFGYSAGGWLSLMAGFDEDLDVRAIVAGAAPTDFRFYEKGDLVRNFLGASRDERPELWREASPVNHVSQDRPPVFLYQAIGDRVVRPEHAHALVRELEAENVPHEIRWLPRRGHISGFLLPGDSVDEAIRFLDRTTKR